MHWASKPRIMFFCWFFALNLIAFQSTGAPINVQGDAISLNFSNTKVADILKSIEKQSNYYFICNEKLVNLERMVSIHTTNQPLEKVLTEIFGNANVEYLVKGNKVVLTPKGAGNNQDKGASTKIVVSGKVTNAAGEAIPGASISIKNTTQGVVTDIDGHYSFYNVPSNSTLIFSFIGMLPNEVEVLSRRSIDVILNDKQIDLDEVVVVGYGSQKRKEITGSVSSMKMDELPPTGASSVSQLFSGKAAGLNTNLTSAQPGGKMDLRIRGKATGRAPLIVIDGFPVSEFNNASAGQFGAGSTDAVLASINPNDIASIDVLKDASATSVYGTRAAGGVILITTKRGRVGKTSVEFNSSYQFSRLYGLPKLLNAKDYMIQSNRAFKENFMFNNGVGVYGNKEWADVANLYTPKYSDAEIANFDNNKGTDWLKEITRTGVIKNTGVNISGGNDALRYFSSFGYYENEGVVKNNSYDKYTGQINIDQKFGKKVTGGVSLNLSRVNLNNIPLQEGYAESSDILRTAYQYAPIYSVRDADGNYNVMPSASFLSNPVSMLDIKSKTRTDRMLGNVFLAWDIIEGLRVKGVLGADINNSQASSYVPSTTVAGASQNGVASKVLQTKDDYQTQLLSTYNKTFMDKHVLGLTAGVEFVQSNWAGFSASNQDFISDSFYWNNLGIGAFKSPSVGSHAGKSETLSYISRLNYSYDDRLFFTANFRVDGSSNFARNHQWGYFPGVSLGWDIAKESFFENLRENIDQLKIRAGFGQTGNDNIGTAFFNYYTPGDKALWGDQVISAISLAGLGNPDLKWETQTDLNFGLDFSLFKGRLSGSFEVFNREISDILGSKRLSSASEVTVVAANLDSKKQTYGYEFSLFGKVVETSSFKWNSSLTFSYYRDRWLKRDSNWKPDIQDSEKAYFDELWFFVADGFFKEGDTFGVNEQGVPIPMVPGTVKIKDVDGYLIGNDGSRVLDGNGKPMRTGKPDGKIDNADLVKRGVNAPFSIGFTNSFTYQNFDLNVSIYGKFNAWKWNSVKALLVEPKLINEQGMNQSYDILDSWSSDNQNGMYPSVLQNRTRIAGGIGDMFLQKAWFIRISNIDFGYTFPLKKYKIENLRLFVSLQNPFVITPFKGMDPETDNNTTSYPNQRNYGFGIQLKF